MLVDIDALFSVILYTLGCILLIILIVLSIKGIKTLKKVNSLIDDVQEKSNKINGIFDFVDSTTDFMNGFVDKIVGGISGLLIKMFNKKKEEDKDE